MKNNKLIKSFKVSDFIISIVFTLLIISLGVIFTVNFRPLYYFDLGFLSISERSGYDVDLIKRNYDALIDYNSPFYKGELNFPDLDSSPQGLQHFVEVKDIFMAFYFIAFFAIIACILIIIYKRKQKDYKYLLVSSVSAIVIPIVVTIIAASNFDRTFVLFHKIFFRNDYWIFNPKLDPVINILPQTFFMHALILIIVFILLGSLALFAAYKILNKNRYDQ